MDKGGTSPEVMRRPSGGGSVASIGSDFKTNLNSGTGSYSIPIELPPGRRAHAPELVIQYSSGAGHGVAGLGWTIGSLTVERDTRLGVPAYGATDSYLLAGEPLVEIEPGLYRPAVDRTFQRVRRLGTGWEVTDRQGTRFLVGPSAASQERRPNAIDEDDTLRWHLARCVDTSGNEVSYTYQEHGSRRHLSEIAYATYRVVLEYEDRPDVAVTRRGGFAQSNAVRLHRIAVHTDAVTPSLTKAYDFEYVNEPSAGHSLLHRVVLTGFSSDLADATETAPPLEFGYTSFEARRRQLHRMGSCDGGPPPLGAQSVDLVDLDGFGLPGVLDARTGTHRYWPNRGDGQWGLPRAMREAPAGVQLGDGRVRLGDMDGDGRPDLLVSSGALAGYYPSQTGPQWGRLRAYGRSRPTFDARDRHVRWVDADGDRRVDAMVGRDGSFLLYRGHGADGWDEVPQPIPRRRNDPHHPDVSFADPRVRLADMSGDGLIDVVQVFAHHLDIWPSLGAGRWDERQTLPLPGAAPDRFRPERCFLADLNGNGLTDVVYFDADAIIVWLNRSGAGFSEPVFVRYPPRAAPGSIRIADMLGRGASGVVFGDTTDARLTFLDFSGGIKPYLLETIDNGVGGLTTITYGSSTQHQTRDRDSGDPWNTFLPVSVQVVDRIESEDRHSGQSKTSVMSYHRGQFDSTQQRFVGFGAVDVVESARDGAPRSLTRHDYCLGIPGDEPVVTAGHEHALQGLLRRKTVLDGTDTGTEPLLVETTTWTVAVVAAGLDGTPILFPRPRVRTVERFEQTTHAAVLSTELEHDEFGNVTLERRTTRPADPALASQTLEYHATFINDVNRWVLGLPLTRTLTSTIGEVLDRTRFHYDGLPHGQSSDGLLTRRERLALNDDLIATAFDGIVMPDLASLGYHEEGVGGSSEFWIDEYHVHHNDHGDIDEHHDPLGEVTTITYDDDELFPTRIVNPAGHVYAADYHPRLGTIVSMTDPNGAVSRWSYTPLGRVRREVLPGDTDNDPTVAFEYRTESFPISTVMTRRRESDSSARRRSVVYYDGHGNALETRAHRDDGTFQVAARERRDLANLVVERRPSFVSPSEAFDPAEGPAATTEFQYDALQRVVRVERPGGALARAEFGPDSFRFFDAADNDASSPFADTPRVQTVDPAGRVLAVVEDSGSGTLETSYRYDAADRMVAVVDASASVLLTQTFDLVGRKISIDHRDAGRRRFLHDARGKLSLYVDAEGRTLRHHYDSIGRTVSVEIDGVEAESYVHDIGEGEHLVGRLAVATDRAGSHAMSYDARGRTLEATRSMTGRPESWSYRFSYDPDDRQRTIEYPDGTSVELGYDALGRLVSQTGLIDDIVYDDRGNRRTVDFTTGLQAQYKFDVLTERLAEHALVDPASATEVYRYTYTYDAVGNPLLIADSRPAAPGVQHRDRQFEYDGLGRLARAHGGTAADTFDHRFTYDELGNMTRNGSAQPDELAHDGTMLAGVVRPTGTEVLYGYNANGCLTSRPGMTLDFDVRDTLAGVVRDDGVEITFGYDYLARRVRKRVQTAGVVEETLFIGESFEIAHDGTETRYVRDPGGAATLVSRDGATQVLHQDPLGNTIAVRDVGAGQTKTIHYFAYGQLAADESDLPELLYGGKRLDRETGLYYSRMRYYDPQLGRFISPDPIAVTNAERGRLRPLALNPYVYALDNPSRYTDALGLWTFWEGFLTVVLVVAVVALTAVTFGAAGVIALGVGAAVGALVGGLTSGSVDGALAGAMMGFGIVASVLLGTAVFGPVVGLSLGVIQALGLIPSVRHSDTYKDILGYSSWINPWSWPGHAIGAAIFLVNGIVYGVAYAVTWGDPPDWADMSVSFEQGMVVTEGGLIRPGRAFNFGAFTNLNPDDAGVADPATRELILRHERGHMLNNAYFGVLQVGRIGAGSQQDSFWEQMAESNVNPFVPGLTGSKDANRAAGGRGLGDVPWWNP